MDEKDEVNVDSENEEVASEKEESNKEQLEIQEKDPVEKILNEAIISNCISMLCKTSDGVNYAYVQLYCTKKSITDISILSRYIHLRYIDLSNNNISDISSLSTLQDLLLLDCSSNRIDCITTLDLPYLTQLNLSNNRISNIEVLAFPQLETLNLNGNKFTNLYNGSNELTLKSELLPLLKTLELRGNLMTDTRGIRDLYAVTTVYLSNNKITSITGLEKLVNLQSLHLRDNQITTLDGFSGDLRSLQYLNIRGNRVSDIAEVKKLQDLSLLRALILSGNPISEKDEYRLETLITLRKLVRLDKDNFLDEERSEAEQIYEERLKDQMLGNNKYNDEDDRTEE